MARTSKSEHAVKICGCVKWKECTHPWYVSYREGKELGPNGKMRERGLRCKLATFVGREPTDYADAKAEARRAIVAWKEGRDPRGLLPGDAPTVHAMVEAYIERPGSSSPGNPHQRAAIMRTVVNAKKFGDWRAGEITREMLEAFRIQRPRIGGNRDLQLLRAAFNWGVLTGLVAATPFKVGNVPAIKIAREQARTRRLQPGEDERLLLAAGGLRDLIVAALETGCRKGELLSMQWHQVRFSPRAELFLPATKTKTKRDRRVPISPALRIVLERRRDDPAGDPLPPDSFVFGDEVGRRRGAIKTAWRATCRRAKIDDLHFHDLRREAGSRWMDAGVDLATIQRWLGHSNIAQTSTYLGASLGNDEAAMQRYVAASGRYPSENPLPNVAASSGSNGIEPTSTDIGVIENTQEILIVQGPAGVVH